MCTTLLLAAFGAHAIVEEVDGIAAIVNEDIILVSELQQRYDAFMLQAQQASADQLPPRDVILSQLMERLILESLQLQEAELRGIEIEDEELTNAVRNFARNNRMDLDTFLTSLAAEGISYRQFREDVRRELLLNRIQRGMVNRRIYISDQDIKDLRASPFFKDMVSDEFRVGHILLTVEDSSSRQAVAAAEARAAQIVTELEQGADFGKMAIENSSASTALEGGDLGWRKATALPSLFSDVVLRLDPGETALPMTNSLGVHIIQLLEKRGASTEKETRTLLRHILIQPSAIRTDAEALELIGDIRDQILAGADFADMAIEYSDDAGTALAGGDLGWTAGGDFVEDFYNAMNETAVDEISEPFRSEFGWHILEIQGRREEAMGEEALNDHALRVLHSRRFDEKLQEWLKEIRDEAYVQIRGEEDDDE